jgi:flagellar hook-length control protein FliK
MMPNIDSIPVLTERPVVLTDKNPVAPTGDAAPSFKDALHTAQGPEGDVGCPNCDQRLPKPEEAHKSVEAKPEASKRRADADSDPDDESIKNHEHAQKADDHSIQALPVYLAPALIPSLIATETVPLQPLLYLSNSQKPDSSLQGQGFAVPFENNGVFTTTVVAPFPPASTNTMRMGNQDTLGLPSDARTASPNQAALPTDLGAPAEALAETPHVQTAEPTKAGQAILDPALNLAAKSYGRVLVPLHAQNRGHAPDGKPSSEGETAVDSAASIEESDSSLIAGSPKPAEATGGHATVRLKNVEMEFTHDPGNANTNTRQGDLAQRAMNKTSSDPGAGFKSPAPAETDPFKAPSGFGNTVPDPPTDSGAAGKSHVASAAHEVSSASLGEAKSPMANSVNPAETTEVRSDNLSRAEQFDLVHEIVQKMKVMLRNGDTEVKISLKPEYLGELHLRALIRENVVTASILTQSPEVKEYLASHLPLLQNALQEQGLRIDKLEVTTSGNFSADLSGGNASSSNNGHPRPTSPNVPFTLDLPQNDPSPEPADTASLLEAPPKRLNLTA